MNSRAFWTINVARATTRKTEETVLEMVLDDIISNLEKNTAVERITVARLK